MKYEERGIEIEAKPGRGRYAVNSTHLPLDHHLPVSVVGAAPRPEPATSFGDLPILDEPLHGCMVFTPGCH